MTPNLSLNDPALVGVAGTPPVETPVFLSEYAVNTTISTTTNLDDTLTGTTSGSWGKTCSGVETDGITGYVPDTTDYWILGLTNIQGTYTCSAQLYMGWFINGASVYMYACPYGSPVTYGAAPYATVNVNTVYRIVRTVDTIKFYLDIDGTDSWVLAYTHTDTGNIPVTYVGCFIGVQNSSCVMSTET